MNIAWPKLQTHIGRRILTSLRESPSSRSFKCNFMETRKTWNSLYSKIKVIVNTSTRIKKKKKKSLSSGVTFYWYKYLTVSGFGKRKWHQFTFCFLLCRYWRATGVNTGIGHMGKSCTNSIAHNAKLFRMTPVRWIAHRSLSSFCTRV